MSKIKQYAESLEEDFILDEDFDDSIDYEDDEVVLSILGLNINEIDSDDYDS